MTDRGQLQPSPYQPLLFAMVFAAVGIRMGIEDGFLVAAGLGAIGFAAGLLAPLLAAVAFAPIVYLTGGTVRFRGTEYQRNGRANREGG